MKTIFFFGMMLLPLLAYQQDSKVLWFKSIGSLPNYSPGFNYFVYHDSEGFVWISSTAGLNRFDGRRVQHYHSIPGDSTSLVDDNIQSTFFEDRRKNLWFSTERAIHCYRRKTDDFQQFFPKTKEGAYPENCRAFFLEKDTFLWFRAGQGIYRLNIHQVTLPPDSVAAFAAYRCIPDTSADGSLRFIYGDAACLEIEGGKLKNQHNWLEAGTVPRLPAKLFDVYREGETRWMGTDSGLVVWNQKTGKWHIAGGAGSKNCHFVPWGSKHFIVWIENDGLFLFEKEQEKFSPLHVSLTNDPKFALQGIFDIYLDQQDNLWITFENGAPIYVNLKKVKFKNLPKIPDPVKGNSNYAYWNCLEDEKDNFWLATDPVGLFVLDQKGRLAQHFQHRAGQHFTLPDNWVLDIEQDSRHRIWVATNKGIAWFNSKNRTFHKVANEAGITDLYVLKMLRLKDDGILVATDKDGIFRIRENGGEPAMLQVYPGKQAYAALFEDRAGNIYASRNNMEILVLRFSKDSLRRVGSIPLAGLINAWYEDKSGEMLWVASFSGLAKIDLETFKVVTVFTEKDGLPDKNIHSMLAGDGEWLWLGTAKGLVRFNTQTTQFETFSLADGALSTEFHLDAAARRRNGELWFAGSNGITIIPPGPIDFVKNLPLVKITNIKINDEEPKNLICLETGATNTPQIRHLSLPFDQNTLTFEFAAIEYSDPANNQLRYFLKGVDRDTVTLDKGEIGLARYSNIAYGTHTLWLQAANSDGVWAAPVPVLKITIRPPFYLTWWFLSLSALALAGLTYAAFRWRIAQIREKAELNTRSAENKMAALRAQMNPHFIFNSLNTVNGFIMRQDLKGAVEYVSQFSMLMRNTLEHSRAGTISLDQEIALLELYMSIEARRFSQPFTYSITVGKDLDTFGIKIPSMLLQPFVENAIKHGLFHKKEQGHLNIAFLQENGSLKCVVEDNGVGRALAAEINAQQGRNHVSRGLEIVEERLQILQMSGPQKIALKTIDLFDLQRLPTGTRVEILLPLALFNKNPPSFSLP